MKYIVGIPYINRVDLLRESIDSIKAYWDNLVLIDNSGCQELAAHNFGKDFLLIEPIVPLSVSQSQNALTSMADEKACDFYIYMPNGTIADERTPEKLLELIQHLFEVKRNWGEVLTSQHTLVAYNMEAARNVGQWDTVLPHCFSDADYCRRMILKGYKVINTGLSVFSQNNDSNTINNNYIMKLILSITTGLYNQYYVAKWGGEPGKEQYTVPFHGQDDIMALLAFMQQEYGPTTTLEQVIESHSSMHLKAQQAIRESNWE